MLWVKNIRITLSIGVQSFRNVSAIQKIMKQDRRNSLHKVDKKIKIHEN